MGSGREGGPSSPAMASLAAPRQIFSSVEREDLLEGGINASVTSSGSKANANLSGRFRTPPRGGNTPLHSPRSLAPLGGFSSTEIASSEIATATLVDSQEAIFRSSSEQKAFPRTDDYGLDEDLSDFQARKPSRHTEDLTTEAGAMVTRSKSEGVHLQGGQQQAKNRIPVPASRSRAHLEDVDRHAVVPGVRSNKAANTATGPPSEWVLLDRRRSPRQSKISSAAAMEMQDPHLKGKSSRSSSRKSKGEDLEEFPDADLGMGDASRATRRTHTRPNTRQHKRKTSESVTVIAGASSLPESFSAQAIPSTLPSQQHVAEYQVPPYQSVSYFPATSPPVPSSSRRASREARVVRTSDWLQFIGDVIMWRHVPRSTLLFGLGCFCIMSASMIQDMQYSTFSVVAYVALFYLAARFIRCNFLRGSPSSLSFGLVTEADALRLIRIVLSPLNLLLQKLGDLFSGEPLVTLKVAGALWFLARAASMMNVWTLVRIGFFALFTVPRFYSSYHHQIESQVRSLLDWICSTWSACSHKKAVLVVGFLLLWNFSSVSTRICGGFLVLVAVRAYRLTSQNEWEDGSAYLNQRWHLREGN